MLFGLSKEESKKSIKIKVGDTEIEKSDHTKLLRVPINDQQKWDNSTF